MSHHIEVTVGEEFCEIDVVEDFDFTTDTIVSITLGVIASAIKDFTPHEQEQFFADFLNSLIGELKEESLSIKHI